MNGNEAILSRPSQTAVLEKGVRALTKARRQFGSATMCGITEAITAPAAEIPLTLATIAQVVGAYPVASFLYRIAEAADEVGRKVSQVAGPLGAAPWELIGFAAACAGQPGPSANGANPQETAITVDMENQGTVGNTGAGGENEGEALQVPATATAPVEASPTSAIAEIIAVGGVNPDQVQPKIVEGSLEELVGMGALDKDTRVDAYAGPHGWIFFKESGNSNTTDEEVVAVDNTSDTGYLRLSTAEVWEELRDRWGVEESGKLTITMNNEGRFVIQDVADQVVTERYTFQLNNDGGDVGLFLPAEAVVEEYTVTVDGVKYEVDVESGELVEVEQEGDVRAGENGPEIYKGGEWVAGELVQISRESVQVWNQETANYQEVAMPSEWREIIALQQESDLDNGSMEVEEDRIFYSGTTTRYYAGDYQEVPYEGITVFVRDDSGNWVANPRLEYQDTYLDFGPALIERTTFHANPDEIELEVARRQDALMSGAIEGVNLSAQLVSGLTVTEATTAKVLVVAPDGVRHSGNMIITANYLYPDASTQKQIILPIYDASGEGFNFTFNYDRRAERITNGRPITPTIAWVVGEQVEGSRERLPDSIKLNGFGPEGYLTYSRGYGDIDQTLREAGIPPDAFIGGFGF